jgi:hypothetical protein
VATWPARTHSDGLSSPGRPSFSRVQYVISWQVGAADAGEAGRIGLLIGATNLAILGPPLTVLAVLVAGTGLVLTRLAPGQALTQSPGAGTGCLDAVAS